MSDLELERLKLLMQTRRELGRHVRENNERLEDFVQELLDSGSSVRVIAEALEVGTSTVQNWAANAVTRREPSAGLE